jgi:ribonucleoside-triphosphate reductase
MSFPKHIKKRDGSIDEFNSFKIKEAIFNAVKEIYNEKPEPIVEEIYSEVINKIGERFVDRTPEINDIQEIIIESAKEIGYEDISIIYRNYSQERDETRKFLAIATSKDNRSTTDAALLIESDTEDTLKNWDRNKIIEQLKKEANLSHRYAEKIAKKVENSVVGLYKRGGIKRFQTTDIRILVDMILRQEGLEAQRKKQALLGLPSADLQKIIFSRSNENSNIASNNPEAVNLEIAERIQKPWALGNIFSEEVANAHLNGEIHIHDLGYPTRVYCSSHSVEYIKKYGLNKILANLESKSKSPNSALVLNQHLQTFLASMQAHYAGALGFGFLNILYAPLLNKPTEVVKGRFNGKGEIKTFEKRDFERYVKERVFSLNENDENYFRIEEEKLELKEIPDKEFNQVAQNLIYASSQNAFSRGGQTLFIDFNIHTGVPNYIKNVPAIGPKGKYIVKMPDNSIVLVDEVPRIKTNNTFDSNNGDADSSQLKGELKGGKIITYGDLEPTAQKFAMALLEIWREGDRDGRPFHFPKCDLHVDKDSFLDKKQREVLEFAIQVATENGSTYFMFDRGNGAVLAQCCRLKERVEDNSMLKYPEKLRFVGFQNITINLAQAAYIGKDLKGTLKRIEHSMNLALKAHLEKKEFIQKLLDTDGSPMRNLGAISDDGTPYIDLKKSTYIIGNIGLNEAVQVLTGKELHESEEAYETGLKIIVFMYQKIHEFKKKTGLKFTIEETPAESATRRLAIIDKEKFSQAKKVVKGTDENPYYTNSIHFAPGADVGMIDRIVGQSKFHDLIESGAIIHSWVGEQRPDKEAITFLVKTTLENTRCSQLVFSPTYTECNRCNIIMAGEKELCTNPNCFNSSKETVDLRTLNPVTRVVGYYSGIKKWNSSQVQINEDRKKAEKFYAGANGRDMAWLYSPSNIQKLTIIEFGKRGCPNCEKVKQQITNQIKKLGFEEKIDFKIHYLDDETSEGLLDAARYSVPFDSVPTLVIAGKKSYWKKTAEYGAKSKDSVCEGKVCHVGPAFGEEDMIKKEEIESAINEKLPEYGLVFNS